MPKEKRTKRPRQMTLFFGTRDECLSACERLGLSQRKCTSLDKKGEYSALTGHYGQRLQGARVLRVPLRFKLTLDQEAFQALSYDERTGLGFLDGDTTGWIAS